MPGASSSPMMRFAAVSRMPQDDLAASVRWAVRVMYGGAATAILGIIVNVMTLGVIREQRPFLSTALRTSTQRQAIAEFIVGGIAVATIWVFVALACRGGAGWARLASTVLFAIYTVYTAEIVAGFDRVRPAGAVQVYTVIVWLTGLTAVILLWRRDSTSHFRSAANPR